MSGTVRQDPVKAIALMVGAAFMLSVMDVGFKKLVVDFPSIQVTFFRCVISAPLFLAWILIRDRRLLRTAYPGGHLLRASVGLLMLWSVGECFREMPLADAYALFFAAPLLITLLSGPVLGEHAGPVRIIVAAIGWIGVLLVLRPGGQSILSYGALMGLLAVVSYTATSLLLRRLGSRDSTVTIAFMFTSGVGLGSGLLSIAGWVPIETQHWPWLILIGLAGTAGQLMITQAYRTASAAVVAPYDYTHMLWAVLFGFLFFGDIPGLRTWAGAAIVMASGLFILLRESRRLKRQRDAAIR